MSDTQLTPKQKIALIIAGYARTLDEKHPGWEHTLNLLKLDLKCRNNCVIGQLLSGYGTLKAVELFGEGFNKEALGDAAESPNEHHVYDAWVREVNARRSIEETPRVGAYVYTYEEYTLRCGGNVSLFPSAKVTSITTVETESGSEITYRSDRVIFEPWTGANIAHHIASCWGLPAEFERELRETAERLVATRGLFTYVP